VVCGAGELRWRTLCASLSVSRKVESCSRADAIQHALPNIRRNLTADPGGPERYGGVRALELTAQLLQQAVSLRLAGHLTNVALPLAARRRLDDAAFLGEAGNAPASTLLEHQARLFGAALDPYRLHPTHGYARRPEINRGPDWWRP
jgi:hypothetical protein